MPSVALASASVHPAAAWRAASSCSAAARAGPSRVAGGRRLRLLALGGLRRLTERGHRGARHAGQQLETPRVVVPLEGRPGLVEDLARLPPPRLRLFEQGLGLPVVRQVVEDGLQLGLRARGVTRLQEPGGPVEPRLDGVELPGAHAEALELAGEVTLQGLEVG